MVRVIQCRELPPWTLLRVRRNERGFIPGTHLGNFGVCRAGRCQYAALSVEEALIYSNIGRALKRPASSVSPDFTFERLNLDQVKKSFTQTPIVRYILLQLPGAGLVLGFLWWLHASASLALWVAVAIFLLWIGKDVALYPVVRRAYESTPPPLERLIGLQARVIHGFDRSGLVRLGSELWQAELLEKSGPVSANDVVIVESTRGLTLMVYRQADEL